MRVSAHPFHLVAGLTLWAGYFVLLYGGMSVACALSPQNPALGPWTWINLFVLLLTVLVALPLAGLAWACHRQTSEHATQERFLLRVSALLYFVSAIATLVVGLPGVIYPPCV